MEAVRCTQCGGTRWSLMPGSLTHLLEKPCELCGGDRVIERWISLVVGCIMALVCDNETDVRQRREQRAAGTDDDF